ncbi:MAG: hypothetical protein PHD00_05545 [Bacteroidales bacterium]|jgi:hypothetical protein|nr:hypothetical protein [Bacteroidales bacterium]MDD4673560.1 hypothetical protein [Bacteroidales bacterium]
MKIKSLKYLALAMFAGVLTFTSCEKDPEVFDAPTIMFVGENSMVLDITEGPAYVLEFSATITAPGKIESVSVERSKILGNDVVGDVESKNYSDSNSGLAEATIRHEDNINSEDFTDGTIDKIEYAVVVTDEQGEVVSAVFTVTLPFTKLEAEKEGEVWKIQSFHGKGSWNLKDDVAVTAVGNEEDVVATRYMINNNGVSTSGDVVTNFDGSWSSGTVNWNSDNTTDGVTEGNGTKFVKADGYDYELASIEVAWSLFNAAGEDNQSTEVDAPAVDDIYIGVLDDEIYVIKVTEVDETAEAPAGKANTGVLRFTYKK